MVYSAGYSRIERWVMASLLSNNGKITFHRWKLPFPSLETFLSIVGKILYRYEYCFILDKLVTLRTETKGYF